MSDEEDKLYEEYAEQMPLPMPKSWTDLHAKFEDHAYFFILTSRQALKASWVLEQRHEQMPHFRQEDRMRAWRDYLEHWDKPDSHPARLGGLHPARTGLRTTKPKETTTTCFDLLAPVLDGAHQRGIGVVLGTPTYAASPWLARRYPEIAGEPSTGQPVPWGGRQEIDYTHPAFKFYAERIIRKIVSRMPAIPQ